MRSFDRAPSLLPAHPQLEVQGFITDADTPRPLDGIGDRYTAAIIELMGGASVTDEYRQRSSAVNVAAPACCTPASGPKVQQFIPRHPTVW